MVTPLLSGLRQPAPFFLLWVLSLGVPATGFTQSPQGNFDKLEISVDQTAQVYPDTTRSLSRYVVGDEVSVNIADLRLEDDKPVLRVADRAVDLPLRLNTAVSKDGRTILQHGDALIRMHPVRTDLFWISPDGEISASVRNAYDGDAQLDMSADGFTVVAGQVFFKKTDDHDHDEEHDPGITHIDLYNPKGEKLKIAGTTSRQVMAVRALRSGQGMLVNTSAPADSLSDHQLVLYLEDSKPRSIEHRFGIVQKIVILSANAAFIQGTEAYGIVNTADGLVVWQTPDRIRLISPQGAALDPRQNRLFLMSGTRVDQDNLAYDWTLSILAADTGEPLGQIQVPGPIPSTPGPVFTNIRVDAVSFLAGDRQLTVRLRRLP